MANSKAAANKSAFNSITPPPMPTLDAPLTLTKTKTRTKTVVLTLISLAALGGLAWAGVAVRQRTVCDSGPNAGQACTRNEDCKRPEARNARCVKVSTLPDLAVRSMAIDPATPQVGDHLSVNMVVENRGVSFTPIPVGDGSSTIRAINNRLRIDVGNDGTWDVLPSTTVPVFDSLAAGATATVRWDTAIEESIRPGGQPLWVVVAGTHTVEVCTDMSNPPSAVVSPGVVIESDETNNCRTLTLTVSAPLPDFHNLFERIPDTPTEGAPFTLRVQVQNLGTAVAGPSVESLRLDLGNDGQGVGTDPYGAFDETLSTRAIPGIAAGATAASVEWNWPAWPAGGPHRLVMCADSGLTVSESDENNNCSVTVIVANPAPAAQGRLIFSLHPASPSGASVPGIAETLRFTMTAPDSDVLIRGFAFRLNTTDNNGRGTVGGDWNSWQGSTESVGLTPSDFQLYDLADLSTPLVGTWRLAGPDPITNEYVEFTGDRYSPSIVWSASFDFNDWFQSPFRIPAGTTKSFSLRIDTTGASAVQDDTLRVWIDDVLANPRNPVGLPLRGETLIY